MLLRDIHHVSINVTDVDRAIEFYVGVLGMEVLPRPAFPFGGAWLGMGGDRQVHLVEADVPSDLGQHVAFQVDDIDAAAAALAAAGVRVKGPFPVGDSGARQAFLADPDGNRLELNQPV